jgi:hypothetical protein
MFSPKSRFLIGSTLTALVLGSFWFFWERPDDPASQAQHNQIGPTATLPQPTAASPQPTKDSATPIPPSDAERWLRQQASDAVHIKVSYGGGYHVNHWKHIAINDLVSIRKIIYSLRCRGSLTNVKLAKRDDGLRGMNTSYDIYIEFKNSKHKPLLLVINPSNDQGGTYFLTRRLQRDPDGSYNTILGWAEMDEDELQKLTELLKHVPGNRSVTGYD